MNIKNLRKSILQYAVEGKLVQQDIQDEPASILYDKIIKEKENLINKGQIKKEKPLPPVTDDEIPYNIPESWKWVRLGEVCEIYTGNSINAEIKNKKYTNLKQGYNYIATKDVNFNTIIDYDNGVKIPFNEINFKIAQKNTTLICVEGGSAGKKIGFLNQDVCFGNKLCNIKGYLLYNQYLFYFAQSPIFLSLFNACKAGIIGGVSVNLIKNILLPLPPLKEQERIVKKVDKLMALCDKLEQEEEKLLSLDKHFADNLPKSILQHAVEGKLVQQNIQDEHASILYDKIIKEKENLINKGQIKKEKPLPPVTDDEIPYNIPESWKWVRLGEVCEIYTGNSINAEIKNKKYTNLKQGYNYIATKDVNFNTIIDYDNGVKIPFNEINFKIAQKNTTLICVEGGSAGKKIGFLNQDVCFGNKLCNIKGYLLYNQYLFYFAQSPIFLSLFNACKAGIIGGVSVNLIKNILLPLPPLKEQERIVKKVDELLTYCNKLKDII